MDRKVAFLGREGSTEQKNGGLYFVSEVRDIQLGKSTSLEPAAYLCAHTEVPGLPPLQERGTLKSSTHTSEGLSLTRRT